ncbi:MAG: GTPase HflX [Elusimicrobia bacterium]|nr:GTPase HflX [Elusimicrobiota bacterium]
MINLKESERVILVGIVTDRSGSWRQEDPLLELEELVKSAGGVVAEKLIQRRETLNSAILVGQGKAQEIKEMAQSKKIHCVIFDEELSPSQQRNLEEIIGTKIIDRTGLILDVFARRARTKEGMLQVELAQNTYRLTRLTGRGAAYSQQWGGIGTRGPGERALEYDRRRLRDKIQRIRKQIAAVRQERSIQRSRRITEMVAQIALIGYTNAGKSSLLNKLCAHADQEKPAYADDRLFATLDPLTRKIYLPGGLPALVTDTVGFIRKLPTHLIASFRATLEEIEWADLLLIISDPTQSPQEEKRRSAAVNAILSDLKVIHKPVLRALTKADLLHEDEKKALLKNYPGHFLISSVTGEGLNDLLNGIEAKLVSTWPVAHLTLSPGDGYLVSRLYQQGRVIEFSQDKHGGYRIKWQAAPSQMATMKGLARNLKLRRT